jgi:CspA family cold shock protein
MATGIVTRFNPNNGYGFITDDETNEPVFAHQSDIKMDGFRLLNKGDLVSFDMIENDKGFKAENIVVTKANNIRRGPKRNYKNRKFGGNNNSNDNGILHRLIEVLGDDSNDDPILLREDIDYIKHGNRSTVI